MIDDRIGKVIKSYELGGLLGTGGFGAVYRATQAVIDREVAIKIIWPAFASHPNFIRRFESEAQLVAGLEHPHIVPLYDYWRDPDGAYIVMRYLRGGALRAAMDKQDAWRLDDVSRLLGQVAAALALAHRAGVVHRDIKPANILLDKDENAYLADFGIAQIVSNARSDDEMMAGMGSPAYAAPEQVTGGVTTPQSDLYSLGIIIYEMLTGKHPFPQLQQLSMTEMNELRATEPVPTMLDKRPELSPALNDVIQRVTALAPDDRYPDALTFSRAFQDATGQAQRQSTRLYIPEANDIIPNPYQGLRPFQESDAAHFFGRETLVRRLLNRLREENEFSRFLAIVGPSGSGKSSVVKAGVLPALREGAIDGSENWFYDEVVPGGQPFEEIANALVGIAVTPPANLLERLRADERGLLRTVDEVLPDDDPDAEFLLVIDQFEELFTLVDDDALIEHFLLSLYTAVTDATSRLRVMITIRADFYDRPLLQPRLSDLVRERTEVVVPLSEAELEEVIVEPARQVGVMIDSGLVAAIAAEIKEQPGALPLLQYSLRELFERREGNMITPDAYREIGGVRGALARRADELYNQLNADEQEATRQLFLRLITLGEGTDDTRRRALLSEVTSIRDDDEHTDDAMIMSEVVDKLGKARLLTFDRDPVTRSPTVEVTHEAIIREWSRLQAWLDESRHDVRMQRTLSQLAQDWDSHRRDTSYLLRGVQLDRYEKWAQETSLALTEQESNYLAVSIAERRRRERTERQRQERERQLEQQTRQRLMLLVSVLAVAFVGALVLTGVALNESQRATQEAEFSQSIAWEAGARRALSDADTDLALLLALQANDMPDPPVESRSTLAQVAFSRGTRAVLDGHTAQVNAVDVSPDGTLVASASTDQTVRVWDVEAESMVQMLDGHTGDVSAVAFSPDGERLYSGAGDFVIIAWDVSSGDVIRRFELSEASSPVRALAVSADGSRIAAGYGDGLVVLWDAQNGDEIMRLEGHSSSVQSIALSPDGETLLSGARDGTLFNWRLDTMMLRGEFTGHDTTVTAIDFDSSGEFAVSSSADGEIILWDMDTGTRERRFVGNTDEIRAVEFTSDGKSVYAAAIDGGIQIWDVATGLLTSQLRGHADAVLDVAIGGDGDIAASGSRDTTVRVWNVGQPGARLQREAHQQRVSQVSVSADGERIVTAGIDSMLRVWDADSGDLINEVALDNTPVFSLALNADGSRALVGSRDGFLAYINVDTGEILGQLDAHTDTVEDVIFLPDGDRALSAGLDGVIHLWNVPEARVIREYTGHDDGVYGLALSPDGTQFASASRDTTAIVWDIDSGERVHQLTGHEGAVYSVAINADGTRVATAGRDRQIIVWDMANGDDVTQLLSDTDTVWSLDYGVSPDQLLSGTDEGAVIVWDVPSSAVLERFDLDDAISIFDVTFTPDGEYALTAQENGIFTMWYALQGEALRDWVRENRYIREWTCLEREQYRITPLCERDE